MLKEKRTELDAERRKALLDRVVGELSRSDPDLYYRSTSEVAMAVQAYAAEDGALRVQEQELLRPLSKRDIEVLLSLR